MKTQRDLYPFVLLIGCIVNATLILYVSTLRFGGPEGGEWIIVAFISECLAPVLTLVGLGSAIYALVEKKPSGLLWSATVIAVGSGIWILAAEEHPLVASLCYWPSFLFASLISLRGIVQRRALGLNLTILILALPGLYYGLRITWYPHLKELTEFRDNSRMGDEEFNEACQVNRLLMDYYIHFPDRFHYVGSDDQVAVIGFVDLLKSKQLFVTDGIDGRRDQFQFKGNSILNPIGEPLIFLLDRHHDGYLRFQNLKQTVNGWANPWQAPHFSYSSAVGVVVHETPQHPGDEVSKMPLGIVPFTDNDYRNLYPQPSK
jgi:hypothetical protein